MRLPWLIKQFLERYHTPGAWKWWAGEPLPEDETLVSGHSTLWAVPWLFPRAARVHDFLYPKVKEGKFSVKEWNGVWEEIAKIELKEARGFNKFRLKLLFPVAKIIVKCFTEARLGSDS